MLYEDLWMKTVTLNTFISRHRKRKYPEIITDLSQAQ